MKSEQNNMKRFLKKIWTNGKNYNIRRTDGSIIVLQFEFTNND